MAPGKLPTAATPPRARRAPRRLYLLSLGLAFAWLGGLQVFAADTLNWRTNQNRVSADIKAGSLLQVLGQVAGATGWQVFVEPGPSRSISAKFTDLAPGEALRSLLGDLNFALVPATNSRARLFVFHTSMGKATQLIPPAKDGNAAQKSKLIANELIVRLKPGMKIDELARKLGAKVIGSIEGLNTYRLQFEDQAAADAAREQMASNPDVASVDSNYSIDRPTLESQALPTASPPPQLQIDPPPDNCAVIVGLVDTAVQPLGNNLDPFLTKRISVAGDAQLDPNTPSHGTSMAQTLLRSLQAANNGRTTARAIAADVYGPNASTSTFDVANGIAQVVNAGAKIVNLSLGSDSESPFLHSVIQDASAKNILFIGAAGNTPVTTPFYPAAYPEVNAVTAIEQGQLASYANRGSFVTLGAPDSSIVSFNSQSWYVVGTSASAAFTSGAATSYLEAHPCSTPAATQAFLRSQYGVKITTTP